jgi:hypothetical protein
MQSNDTQRLMDLCPNFHLVWSAPLQIVSTQSRDPGDTRRISLCGCVHVCMFEGERESVCVCMCVCVCVSSAPLQIVSTQSRGAPPSSACLSACVCVCVGRLYVGRCKGGVLCGRVSCMPMLLSS